MASQSDSQRLAVVQCHSLPPNVIQVLLKRAPESWAAAQLRELSPNRRLIWAYEAAQMAAVAFCAEHTAPLNLRNQVEIFRYTSRNLPIAAYVARRVSAEIRAYRIETSLHYDGSVPVTPADADRTSTWAKQIVEPVLAWFRDHRPERIRAVDQQAATQGATLP